MRIGVIAAHSDDVRFSQFRLQVFLRYDEIAHHATRFANVELMRPVVRVLVLILAKTPFVHFLLQVFRNARIVREEVVEALNVIDVVLPDALTLSIGAFGIAVVLADVVG